MQLLPPEIAKVKGAVFSKLFGTGSGFGFSLKPDFSTYALLIKWENNESRDAYFKNGTTFQHLLKKSQGITTYILHELGAHGSWQGKNPFEQEAEYNNGQLAIITRARINLNKLPGFWANVPKASKAIKAAKGLVFTKGIGEWPLIEQATFSIWEDKEKMMAYAYNDTHKEIIAKTKKQQWYKEELFARFNVIDKVVH